MATGIGTQGISDTESRFEFGENWQKFNASLSDSQRRTARESLTNRLGDIRRLSFLDVGAGSGLFSQAAMELGATVRAFDFDPARPEIERGDVLDREFIASLGQFDIVYAWGVLHHTGQMWQALSNVCDAVAPDGRLFISIYNDQGWASVRWRQIKRLYNRLPRALRPLFVVMVIAPYEFRSLIFGRLRGKRYVWPWREYERGMKRSRDMVDWVGGYPFEVAKPEEVFDFCRMRGFTLEYIATNQGGSGCNEFIFQR
jgi:2-polyprenyl-6-hydroxyphenyl methylase/3-demethylubiquinone-9 3-methyltransferase